MNSIYKVLIGSVFVVLFGSCQETIFVDIPETEPRIVIEGQFTSKPSTYLNFVRVSMSSGNSSVDGVKAVHKALVYIEDENGKKDTLKESWEYNGVYNDSLIKAELGKSYQLHVEVDGKVYESNIEQMAQQAPIDTAWGQDKKTYVDRDFLPPFENDFFIQVGYKKITSITDYSRWQLRKSPSVNKKTFTNEFTIDNDELFSGAVVEDRPLFLDSFELGDTVNVERFSLNRDAYDFWLGLETQLSNSGSPFDTPPAPLFTNLKNIADEREQVLGYFTVSQLDEYRVIIK